MRMAMGINMLIFILALLSFANSESSNKAEKQPCFAPMVKKGQAGKLTFFIRHDLISSTDFFATIKRANNPVKDILVCTPGPPMNCEVDSPYLLNGTANDSLTLLIPNITKEFADTYLLQIYASGSFQQPSVCPLVVEACDDGWYGSSCNRSCGSCLGDTPCNKTSGYCTACKPGWRLPFCQKSCDDGWYGLSCTSRCGSCLGDQPCDKTTGHCTKCQPGLMSPFCQKAPKQPCRAHATTEGLTGTLTYFINSNALSSADFFATIRRTQHPDDYILVCTRRSPIRCNVNDQQYRSRGIRGNRLDLWIPNVTREFDDSYVFQVYANGSFQLPDTCHLVVKALRLPCRAPAVTEGLTGNITFYIHPNSQSSQDFFATIRRTQNPDKDILVCTRRSPIHCSVNDQQYRSRGIRGNRLDLLIPNVTRECDDSYVFQVYANGTFRLPDTCHLVVKDKAIAVPTVAPDHERRTDNDVLLITAVVGSLGTLVIVLVVITSVFCVRKKCHPNTTNNEGVPSSNDTCAGTRIVVLSTDLLVTRNEKPGIRERDALLPKPEQPSWKPDDFDCHSKRNHDGPDASRSDNQERQSSVRGKIPQPSPKPEESISRRNKDEQACDEEEKLIGPARGKDPLQPPPKPEQRSPTSDKTLADKKDKNLHKRMGNQQEESSERPGEQDHGETIPSAKLLPTQQPQNPCPPSNKNQQKERSERPGEQDHGETKPTAKLLPTQQPQNPCPPSNKPPIGREQINAHGGMRWFVKNLKEVEVHNLFKYAKPRAGCFVITQTGSSSFMLAVCWKGQGQVDRYYIDQNDSGFTLNNTKEQFQTLCKLVSHYRTTPVRVGENDLGTLSKPCEEDPIKYAWYFGSLTADEVEKLLLANHTEEGSFLVTENVTDKNNYSLSVKFGGKLVPFTIVPQDDGFKISHEKFRTLQNLVEHYTKNVLDGRGKLRKPLEIIPKELTTEERQILEKNGPGSFFFKDSSIPNRRVLAVNANGKMKQLVIIKSIDGYRLPDHDTPHADEVALVRSYKTKELSLHGEMYGYLRKNCTHDLEEEKNT